MTIKEYKQKFLELHAEFEKEHGIEADIQIIHRYHCRDNGEPGIDCEIRID